MFSIHFNKLQFYSFHGLYEEEKIIGGNFELNAIIYYSIHKENNFEMKDCVNYSLVYKIIHERMQLKTELLENIVNDIAQTILAQFSQVTEVDISLTKTNPPIQFLEGEIAVRVHKKR